MALQRLTSAWFGKVRCQGVGEKQGRERGTVERETATGNNMRWQEAFRHGQLRGWPGPPQPCNSRRGDGQFRGGETQVHAPPQPPPPQPNATPPLHPPIRSTTAAFLPRRQEFGAEKPKRYLSVYSPATPTNTEDHILHVELGVDSLQLQVGRRRRKGVSYRNNA